MVTFRRDLEFAACAMRSVRKYATGFDENIVAVPVEDAALFREMAKPLGFTVIPFEDWPGKGFLKHMAVICQADAYCYKADAILHLDSDCLFTEPVDASDYFINGKPVLYREKFENFRHHANRYGWKATVRSAIGIDPEYEYMVRHPAVHVRSVYAVTRTLIEANTGMPWERHIALCRNEYPQTFAEFPTLGVVAQHYFEKSYHFIEQAHGNTECLVDKSRGKVKDFWGPGGLDFECDRHPGQTARQVIDKILA